MELIHKLNNSIQVHLTLQQAVMLYPSKVAVVLHQPKLNHMYKDKHPQLVSLNMIHIQLQQYCQCVITYYKVKQLQAIHQTHNSNSQPTLESK